MHFIEHKSGASSQFNNLLFGFGVVAGGEDHSSRLLGREVLYPVHWHATNGFKEPRANCLNALKMSPQNFKSVVLGIDSG